VLYSLLKKYARLAIRIYCRKIVINKPEILQSKGPILFASNHPNSFLDGMILTTLLDEPLYSLARGDAFRKSRANNLLRWLKLLPVYRTSEGVENLEHNYTTFAACQETFKKNGLVLIFSEGRCENEWHLRPLKKGTARLAITSWKQAIPLTVIPVGFNYSSFKKFGKEVHLHFGESIQPAPILDEGTEGRQLLAFNGELKNQLQQLVYEIDPHDKATVHNIFSIKKRPSFYVLLLPAIIGWIAHAPLFYPCKIFAHRFKGTGHYDSVLNSLLLLLYPIYLLVILFLLFSIQAAYALCVLLLPFTARACVEVKYQADL
jgi:1-acyl-sn-glycerol-3-phosphate acyltransferase